MNEIAKQNYNRWINSKHVDEETKNILKNMSENDIDDAFFQNIQFGTAGMRGVIGPGTNRMNYFTVKRTTIGFAKYLLEKFNDASVVISHDNRHLSREFTLESAKIFNELGIKAYIFGSLRPTPELSFAVRYLKASGGIMITASHNPKEQNGYKVYDETGCQIVPSKIERLLDIINALPNELDVSYEPANKKGETIVLNNDIDNEYIKRVESLSLRRDLDKKNFKIVFTPNHGTSYVNGMKIFNDLNYEVYPLLKQCDPDPNFSGTLSPNPEDYRSFIEPIKYAKEIDADLIIMTDPDGDRAGLACKLKDGSYKTFTGNQSCAMLMDYIFNYKKEHNLLSKNGVMYNTIVTSSIGKEIAEFYGVKNEQFLTGFKFIGNRIDYYEKLGYGPKFEFGYEESYGCLIGDFARDKDGLQAILMYSEMALYYFRDGKNLDEVWDELGERFGYHQDVVYSIELKGSDGLMKMKDIMNKLRENPFIQIGNIKVNEVDDILLLKHLSNNGETRDLDFPKSDVIKLYFNDESTIAIRPSGTEPKIKFYIGIKSKIKPLNNDISDKLFNGLKSILNI